MAIIGCHFELSTKRTINFLANIRLAIIGECQINASRVQTSCIIEPGATEVTVKFD